MRLYYHSGDKPVPSWIRRLFCQHPKKYKIEIVSASKNEISHGRDQALEHSPMEDHKAQWEALAKKLDVIGFIVFFLVFLTMTLAVFLYIYFCDVRRDFCAAISRNIFTDQENFALLLKEWILRKKILTSTWIMVRRRYWRITCIAMNLYYYYRSQCTPWLVSFQTIGFGQVHLVHVAIFCAFNWLKLKGALL